MVNYQFCENLIGGANETGLLYESVPARCKYALLARADSWIINRLNVVFRK